MVFDILLLPNHVILMYNTSLNPYFPGSEDFPSLSFKLLRWLINNPLTLTTYQVYGTAAVTVACIVFMYIFLVSAKKGKTIKLVCRGYSL